MCIDDLSTTSVLILGGEKNTAAEGRVEVFLQGMDLGVLLVEASAALPSDGDRLQPPAPCTGIQMGAECCHPGLPTSYAP